MPKSIALIPLRGGSKSIPLKNIKNFCGQPLCYWVLKELQGSIVDKIVVATDSSAIKETVLSFGFSKLVVYDREPQNAQDTSSTESVMLEFIEKSSFDPSDLFILVQATSPFTKALHFNESLSQIKAQGADSLLSAVLTKRFFWHKNINGASTLNYDYMNRPRRQDFEGMYMENGAFYINSVANIIKYKNRLYGKIAIYEMPEHTSLEIDEPIDWILAEHIMNNLK
jgi:CMP-N-acetylneuraminic acid synthetase